MKLRQTLILGSVVLVTTGMIGATPTPTEVDSVVSQAPRGLEVDEWVGEMIEAEIGELERLRLEVGGDVESEAIDEDEEDEGDGVVDIDEKDGEDGDEGEGDEDDEAEKPKEPKHPKHPKDDKRNHKHGEGKVEKKHKHKGDKHGHEHNGKHGKHHGAPPRGPPHGPSPHGPPHGGSHGGPPPHHPPKPHPPPAGPPEHKKSGHKDKGPRPPHRHHETDGPDDEDQMDDFIRIEDEEDRDPLYNGVGDENAAQLSEGPYEGERDSARQGRHHHHGYHHMDGMTGSGRGHHGLEHRRGFFQQLSASLTEFKPFEAIVLVVTFTLGLISMMKTAVMLFFFAQRGGRGGKRGWMKHMGIRGGGKHGPGHKRGMGRGGRGGRKTGSGSSGGSGSEDEGANLLVVVDGKYRDEKA